LSSRGRKGLAGLRREQRPNRRSEIFGDAGGASISDVRAAHRKGTRIYHSDKVASLAPEVRGFADNKIRK
jgi:preprotein translocase subunit Sec63